MFNCLWLIGEFWFFKEWKKNYEMNEFVFWIIGMVICIVRGLWELIIIMYRNCWDFN